MTDDNTTDDEEYNPANDLTLAFDESRFDEAMASALAKNLAVEDLPDDALDELGDAVDAEREARWGPDEATDEDVADSVAESIAGTTENGWRMEDSLVLASDYETVAEYAADEETSLVSDVSYAHGYAYATFRDELPDTSPLDVNSDVVTIESVDYAIIDGDVRLGFEATSDPETATDGGEGHPWEPDVGRDHPDPERDPDVDDCPEPDDRWNGPGGGGPW